MHLTPVHLLIFLAVVVLLFGGKKIPELMNGVGRGMSEFKKGAEEGKRKVDEENVEKVETKV